MMFGERDAAMRTFMLALRRTVMARCEKVSPTKRAELRGQAVPAGVKPGRMSVSTTGPP
jgi:hypothetical protein